MGLEVWMEKEVEGVVANSKLGNGSWVYTGNIILMEEKNTAINKKNDREYESNNAGKWAR